jgi:glycosyltransferase involved in cell wall biosynthesis
MKASRPLFVLHVIVGLNVGGAERVLQRLIMAHQDSLDFRHEVISLTDEGVIGRELKVQGIPVYALGLIGFLNLPLVLWRLYRLLKELKPDIVQTWMYHADLFGGFMARLAGIRNVVWGLHSNDIGFHGTYSARKLFKFCVWTSPFIPSKILSVSQQGADLHIKAGYAKDKMEVLPNGFDLSWKTHITKTKEEFRKELGLQEGISLVGFVARFNAAKDVGNFVRAAGLVAKENEGVRFLLVGQDFDEENGLLQTWIENTGYKDRFLLCGVRNDVADCMNGCDFICLSSRTEAFPGVLGEALSVERPCVSTNVGDAALILKDAGILVPPENAQALAAGMLSMLSFSPEMRAEMGRRGYKHIEEEYSMDVMLARYKALMTIIVVEGTGP